MAASEILIRYRGISVCFEWRDGSDVLADENERRVDVREGKQVQGGRNGKWRGGDRLLKKNNTEGL